MLAKDKLLSVIGGLLLVAFVSLISAAQEAMDIRGVALRMRSADLPPEFRQLTIASAPSAIDVGYAATDCSSGALRQQTCLTLFFEEASNEKRVYAVLLERMRLGSFSDERSPEESANRRVARRRVWPVHRPPR